MRTLELQTVGRGTSLSSQTVVDRREVLAFVDGMGGHEEGATSWCFLKPAEAVEQEGRLKKHHRVPVVQLGPGTKTGPQVQTSSEG